jgi:hypothetical protein
MRLAEIVAVEVGEKVYRVDDEAELDLELTVMEVFGERPGHVVVHKCHRIEVTVSYGGTDKIVQAHPATRIRKVREKAIAAFGIARGDAADLVLRLPETTADLPAAEPVGAFVTAGSCAVTLDLVHATRAQG